MTYTTPAVTAVWRAAADDARPGLAARSLTNLLLYIVDGTRDMFRGAWTDSHPAIGIGCALVIALIGMVVGTRTFRSDQA